MAIPVLKTEVTNQHAKEVCSRAEYNANSIHEARSRIRDFVGDANKKKQKIKVWLNEVLQYDSDHPCVKTLTDVQ